MTKLLIQPSIALSLSKGVIASLVASPDGRIIAGGSSVLWSLFLGKENVIRLWDSHTGVLLHQLEGHLSLVSALAFNADGSVLISGSLDGSIKLWNTRTLREQLTIDEASSFPWRFDGKPLRMSLPKVDAIALHPNQHWIAASAIDGTITLWDSRAKAKVCSFGGHEAFTSIAFNQDGTLLAACDEHAGYNLFDVPQGRKVYPPGGKLAFGRIDGVNLPTRTLALRTITFSPNGNVLFGGSYHGLIIVWDVKTAKELARVNAHKGRVKALLFSATGEYFVSAGDDDQIKLWNAQTLEQICTFEGHRKEICAIALTPNGKTLVSSDADRKVYFWKITF
ncbi:MAG TPA: WD40 repeat domain-containing protein [Leptolyngbyaceae cyanobacterium M33_DOE_097]|uniref:WD40 repeat domain-containing protein n=1 Tax=Oscillatoriales cyanobacterium SpSt-418 TaxID=2282169 RepID=A0A7C3KDQ0_9CYAN|nr:WD40 repeat domain-containing protein [Leptolyngbyaceae cyanobacterium M33_DOE_097]